MQCPQCAGIELRFNQVTGTNVVVDTCPACQGVWLDGGELNQVLAVASQDLQPPRSSKPSHFPCPRCQSELRAFYYPQTYVEIDMCAGCKGLWLQPSEFKEIKIIREHLQRKGTLETHQPVEGFKGDVLRWINGAIDRLIIQD
ncbi:MAG: zf-TFIIB domain-containing protein [Pirellulales bacterium]